MKGILPESIRLRTAKIGFGNPGAEWAKSIRKNFILDQVNSQDFLQSNFWDGVKIKDNVQRFYSRGEWNKIVSVEKYIHTKGLYQ